MDISPGMAIIELSESLSSADSHKKSGTRAFSSLFRVILSPIRGKSGDWFKSNII